MKHSLLLLLSFLVFSSNFMAEQYSDKHIVANRFKSVYERLSKNHFSLQTSHAQSPPRTKKVLHHIWLGPHQIPQRCIDCMNGAISMHSDWEYILWTDSHPLLETLDPTVLEKMDAVENYGAKSDILRLEILRVYGGVYLDVDILPIRPLDPFVHANDFFCGLQRSTSISNAVLGARKGHPLLKEILDSIDTTQVKNTFRSILQGTGPEKITSMIFQHFLNPLKRKFACIYPQHVFFPTPKLLNHITPTTPELEKRLPHTYTIHFLQHSWIPKNQLKHAQKNTSTPTE